MSFRPPGVKISFIRLGIFMNKCKYSLLVMNFIQILHKIYHILDRIVTNVTTEYPNEITLNSQLIEILILFVLNLKFHRMIQNCVWNVLWLKAMKKEC